MDQPTEVQMQPLPGQPSEEVTRPNAVINAEPKSPPSYEDATASANANAADANANNNVNKNNTVNRNNDNNEECRNCKRVRKMIVLLLFIGWAVVTPLIGLVNTIVMTGRQARGPCLLEEYQTELVKNGTNGSNCHPDGKNKKTPYRGTSWWKGRAVFSAASWGDAKQTYEVGAFCEDRLSGINAQVGSSFSCMWLKDTPQALSPDWESEGVVQEYEDSPWLPESIAFIVFFVFTNVLWCGIIYATCRGIRGKITCLFGVLVVFCCAQWALAIASLYAFWWAGEYALFPAGSLSGFADYPYD